MARGRARIIGASVAGAIIVGACGLQPAEPPAFGWPNVPLDRRESAVGDVEATVDPVKLNTDGAEFVVAGPSSGDIDSAKLQVGFADWPLRSIESPGEAAVLRFEPGGSPEGAIRLTVTVGGRPLEFNWR